MFWNENFKDNLRYNVPDIFKGENQSTTTTTISTTTPTTTLTKKEQLKPLIKPFPLFIKKSWTEIEVNNDYTHLYWIFGLDCHLVCSITIYTNREQILLIATINKF